MELLLAALPLAMLFGVGLGMVGASLMAWLADRSQSRLSQSDQDHLRERLRTYLDEES